ncbi:MAG: DNA (cytosine-5-)-methyltransferase [Bacteroidia bacterium]|nr:DNA (cytosine-5-)-methyltransferase [Bacteroidia bacterium]
MERIANKFSELRESAGLSIEEVAEITGYTTRTVRRWESEQSHPKPPIIDKLRQMAQEPVTPYRSRGGDQFTFIDLFAGIGGLRMGFESIGGKCVFTSEWNKFSRQTYVANFGSDHPIEGDITKIDEADIPEHDVLLAGFPCQPFSIAGVSKKNSLGRAHGFADETQGTLFFDVARIISFHKPKAFLLENVKNLKSHDKGRTYKIICETLEDLGYTFESRIIDAKGFVPQHRERIFIAGFRVDTGFDFNTLEIPASDSGPRLESILHPEDGTEEPEVPYTMTEGGLVNPKYTLSPKLWQYLKDYAAKHKAKGNGFGYGLFGPDGVARTLSARYYKDGSEVLIKQPENRPRRLTPRECARLMGFDHSGRPQFEIPVSDTQAYKQFGNAVVVPVVEAVAKHMHSHILQQEIALKGQLRLEI